MGLPALGAEGMGKLRLGALGDVRFQLPPPSALIPDPLAEDTDRQHSLEDEDLPPLPGDMVDDLSHSEQNEHVENGAWFPPGYFDQTPQCAGTS